MLMKFLLVLLVCTVSFGCRKKKVEAPAPQSSTEEATPVAAPSSPAPAVSGTTPQAATTGPHPGEPANQKDVRTAYHTYFAKVGSFPNGWPDMIRHKILPAVPQGKNGQPLDFVQFTLWEAGRPPK